MGERGMGGEGMESDKWENGMRRGSGDVKGAWRTDKRVEEGWEGKWD